MKWIQRYDHPGLGDEDLRQCITESHRIVASGLSRKKRNELGL
jgi:predicted DNA-binding protein (MmcQ/YjbR family)